MDFQINQPRMVNTQQTALAAPNAQQADQFTFFHGSDFEDYLVGSNGKDAMYGYQSGDTIIGYNSDDYVLGMQGNDALYGGNGNDYVSGGQDNDLVSGNSGHDFVRGDAGDDWIYGGQGNDTLNGGDGNDAIYGGLNNDQLFGGAGSDFLEPGQGHNSSNGGEGYDAINLNQSFANFSILSNQEGFQLTNINNGDVNTVYNVEELWFTDGTIDESSLRQYLNTIYQPIDSLPAQNGIPRNEVARNPNGTLADVPSKPLQIYNNIPMNAFHHFYQNDFSYNETGNVISNQDQLNAFWKGLGNTDTAPTVNFDESLIAFNITDSNNPNQSQGVFKLTENGSLFSTYFSTEIGFQPTNTHYNIQVDLLPREGVQLIALDEPHAASQV